MPAIPGTPASVKLQSTAGENFLRYESTFAMQTLPPKAQHRSH